jgi:drug/metabolite transporter (DMT)-like permease
VETYVFVAVLFGAACHAGWNAFLKIRLEPFVAMSLIAIMSAIVVVPVLFVLPVPPLAAWPWIGASMIFHLGYFIGLSEAYRTGDMGQVYPIARGTAPLMTALASTLLLGEVVGFRGWVGILILVAGVCLLAVRGGRGVHLDKRAVAFALFTALMICGYSVSDGSGARTSGNAHSYTAWLFLLDGLMMLVLVLIRRGRPVFAQFAGFWREGIVGGTLSLAAYWIAIWAMTVAPIPLVAALRETSVLFAAVIAVVVLKEPLQRPRIIAALMIVAGLALIRLQ